ncbi:pyridoxamine kinase [Lacrimispora saccharolytica]|uniref:pyridoxal kinase n=1 Tax=Lacrimispora saccharolytica (strain ATCC 35040 / DSM 2544 / NRCC 2533 / WM1) TaxID=610130 RepID=D9R244_LACSW|nr:pyridoxamine kinase [Lacrimispora saccharolytica]ADL04694.1 Phosphomethylpyrimidine kinase type-1 [[Clostridium] saccharolyticum WM1]QRV21077.1 pyridoxamine kinase [Lacrimispora saccharolytica]
MTSEKHQKKIAAIHDLSGYGRCSLTVALPILSALKVQCCPVPTSILSNHTGFPTYFFDDYTGKMPLYVEQWKKLNLTFDGIYSGFLGSEEQIGIVIDMIKDFSTPDTVVLVDPIMGDHGKAYQTYTDRMCSRMKELVGYGDIVTPNLTEACILTGRKYRTNGWKRSELLAMAAEIWDMGPDSVVVTGIREGGYVTNLVAEKSREPHFLRSLHVGSERPGTGDVFSSILAAETVKGTPLSDAVKKAAHFVKACILKSDELHVPIENGVCFEEILSLLIRE